MQAVAQMIKRTRGQPTALTAVHIGYRQWVCLLVVAGSTQLFEKSAYPSKPAGAPHTLQLQTATSLSLSDKRILDAAIHK
ncbi:hypothetical protein IHE31_03340 [Mycetohabitans rhizoxinica]|uniref:Uncharacterized protein n=1 Tax=Mycetohabitans rhizoxinica (strain DSM 19002 / CIP 109453 / HKI 454) TaxID=882378 RepID=E5AKB5_MYCRK|nr:unnamed protein product [Mycetohabitans rhizoxinica HKI 454]